MGPPRGRGVGFHPGGAKDQALGHKPQGDGYLFTDVVAPEPIRIPAQQ